MSSTSKGRISELESGKLASIQLALEIEVWSGGEVDASSLVSRADAALLAAHCRFASARHQGAAA